MRALDLHVALDIDDDNTATDAEIATAVHTAIRFFGFNAVETEVITVDEVP